MFELTELDEKSRDDLLQLSPAQMSDVAIFCNQYPSIDVVLEVEDKVWFSKVSCRLILITFAGQHYRRQSSGR